MSRLNKWPSLELIIKDGQDERMAIISRITEGQNVLDMGCNIGRLSLVLAEKGHHVIGMD